MKSEYVATHLGNAVMLRHGELKLGVTYEKGLRINYISPFGRENISFFDDAKSVFTQLPDGKKWFALGGHRLWKSPEDWHCYYNDNLEASFELGENVFRALTQETSDNLILKMSVEFVSDNKVKITHAVANVGEKTKKIALWAITALDCRGKVTLPFDRGASPLLPNRNVVLWSYTDVADKRMNISNESVTVTPKRHSRPLKVGCFNGGGVIFWEDEGVIFEKRVEKVGANYPDFNCNVECYTDGNVAEIETLSPLYEIHPFEEKEHTEYWTFTKKL
jgi:hypothetical protein